MKVRRVKTRVLARVRRASLWPDTSRGYTLITNQRQFVRQFGEPEGIKILDVDIQVPRPVSHITIRETDLSSVVRNTATVGAFPWSSATTP